LCRVWIYIVAGLVVATLTPEVWAGAAVLFAYLIGLTVWAKQERGHPRGKFGAVALLIVPLIYGLPTIAIAPVGTAIYLGFLAVVAYAVARPARAVAYLIAGISLLDALLIAGHGSPPLAIAAAVGFPATIACQRYVAGT
jgi:4-hydroxybenzoate polyprenyltransferase